MAPQTDPPKVNDPATLGPKVKILPNQAKQVPPAPKKGIK
jgi:hypothetical protein